MNKDGQGENSQQSVHFETSSEEVAPIHPTPSTVFTPQTIPEAPKKENKLLVLLFISLVIIFLGFLGYWVYKNLVQKPTLKSTPESPEIVSDNFCGETEYCSMNENCTNLPENHGLCESKEICDKFYICERGNELLNNFAMEILFVENIQEVNENTIIGYILIRNTENRSKNVDVASSECLNYEGLCREFSVEYPPNFQIEAKDVVVFPVYIGSHNNITGLASLEFTFNIGGANKMFNIDIIFNDDKTCIYQTASMELSRKIYFEEPTKIDWTQHCQ